MSSKALLVVEAFGVACPGLSWDVNTRNTCRTGVPAQTVQMALWRRYNAAPQRQTDSSRPDALIIGKPMSFSRQLVGTWRRSVSPRRVTLHGVRLAVASTLDRDAKGLLYAGRYEHRKIRQLRAKIEPNDVFVDLGAGLGFTALFAAVMIGAGRVTAVEADPRAAAMARANFALNDRAIDLIEGAAVGGEDATVDFYPNATFGTSACFPRAGGIDAIRVPRVDLAALLRERRATVLNVDVEGAEYSLLSSLESFAALRVILVHIHEQSIGYKRSAELIRLLFDHGFAFDLADSHGRRMIFVKAS